MSNACLVFSDSNDSHLSFVQKHLDTPLIVIGSKDLRDEEELTYDFTSAYPRVIHKGRVLNKVASVWCRKPYWAIRDLPVPSMYQEYATQSIKRHVGAISVCFPKAYWLSDYFAIQRAEYKPLQLITARRLGFNVPETLFTSDIKRAKAFIQRHEVTIIKSLSSVYPVDKQTKQGMALWSRKVGRHDAISLDGLHFAPAIFQAAIDTAIDVRVTVVGATVFATSIKTQGVDAQYSHISDSRIGALSGKTLLEPFDLPEEVAQKCIELVNTLGLEFGAIDLVVDKQGIFWFLENNPNGQWAFVEQATNQPIGRAIAEQLTAKTGV